MPLDESLIDRALYVLASRKLGQPDPVDLEVCTQWVEIKLNRGKSFNPSQEIYKNIYGTAPPSNFGNPKSALEVCLKIREVKGASPPSITEVTALAIYEDLLTDICKGKDVKLGKTGCLGVLSLFVLLLVVSVIFNC